MSPANRNPKTKPKSEPKNAQPARKLTTEPGKTSMGIPGLDKLVGGGVPSGSVILLSGCVGTGKTIFSLQFLVDGAMNHNERGLFISFEEFEDKLRDQANRFDWNFWEMEKKGLITLLRVRSSSLGEVLTDIDNAIAEYRPQRLVIDSFTFISLFSQSRSRVVDLDRIAVDEVLYDEQKPHAAAAPNGLNVLVIKKVATELVLKLQSKRITTLLTSEISKNSEWYSRDTVSEFACDGVFLLKLTSIGGNAQRTIELVKLRNNPVKCGIFNFEIGGKGVAVRP